MRALALLALLCGCDAGTAPKVFIALQRDFADFQSWKQVYFGDDVIEGHPTGPRYGYVNHPLAVGDTQYPIGTIIVKVVEVMPSPQAWDIFAMAKRGGNFNADGAKNWEFFTLALNAGGAPVILARGTDATVVDGAGGHGYTGANGNLLRCNNCHGDPLEAKNDYVLSPVLQPGHQNDNFDLTSHAEFDGGADQ